MSISPVPVLTPQGRLRLEDSQDDFELEERIAQRLAACFERGGGHGLLQLGIGEAGSPLSPALAFWRGFAMRFVAAICAREDAAAPPASLPAPEPGILGSLIDAAPPMRGAEYLRADVLAALWRDMAEALIAELGRQPLAAFLAARDSRWHLVGRVHFNLAENSKDRAFPFAFLATYTASLAAHGALRHHPLGQALNEYAGARDKPRLLKLLEPVYRASESCGWIKPLVDSGEIFHPLRWTPQEAWRLLKDVVAMQEAGIVVRMPPAWRGNRPARPKVEATIGTAQPSIAGVAALLDFDVSVSLGGEALSPGEIKSLLASASGLVLVRGQWVEIDAERLRDALDRFAAAENMSKGGGVAFGDAMRLLSGAEIGETTILASQTEPWAHVNAGPWLADILAQCRNPQTPDALAQIPLDAALRPYQEVGVGWLAFLFRLGLGACLADDMGLGKTIQVLSLLLMLKAEQQRSGAVARPSLIVAPASLLANWAAEAARFARSLRLLVAHPAFFDGDLKSGTPDCLGETDIVVTSYAALLRVGWLSEVQWRLVAIDEAQAIKNPDARQTRAVKALKCSGRAALTGTPVENNVRDLWSIFDFLNPGLLGSSRAFAQFVKKLARAEPVSYAPLRRLVAPYILRRLKTDKSVIGDLPDKTEVTAYCHLTRKQAALYQAAVDELRQKLEESGDDIARRGLVLASLMRLKQICNHPAQWLGDGLWEGAHSGKFVRLSEIAETIASRQEKLLVFTQFRQIIDPLADLLAAAFGRPGLKLHGATAVGARRDLVTRFQEDERVPFFVLSLKAGGSGLNLTAASHVIHFDRWWNPAVESQATDRAFRIGQKRNVLVHKFLCRGTIEERIDALIESKRGLAEDLLGGAEVNLTEMNDRELLNLVRLDLSRAVNES